MQLADHGEHEKSSHGRSADMALSIVFAHGASGSRMIGPLSGLCVDGGMLYQKPGGELIGKHRDRQWDIAGGQYSRMDCDGSLTVRFERRGTGEKSATFGPFKHFSLVDGISYVDGRIFACIEDDQAQWFCYENGQAWTTMVIDQT